MSVQIMEGYGILMEGFAKKKKKNLLGVVLAFCLAMWSVFWKRLKQVCDVYIRSFKVWRSCDKFVLGISVMDLLTFEQLAL